MRGSHPWKRAGAVAAAVMMVLAVLSARADVLNVDFNDTGNQTATQSGYDAFVVGTTSDKTVAINGIDIRLFAAGNFDDRDRGAVGTAPHPQSDLLRDFAFRNGGVQLQIGSVANPLPAGVYTFVGYHHDTSGGTVDSGPYVVSDAAATSETRSFARGSTSFDTDTGTPTTQRVQFRSDGSTPVTINMSVSGYKGICGFDLILETPSTLKVDAGGESAVGEPTFFVFDATDQSATSVQRTQHYFATFGSPNSEVEWQIGTATRSIARGKSPYTTLPGVADDWIGLTDFTITLTGLQSGTYDATTYHHEPNGSSGTYDILVDGVTKVTGHSHSTGTGVSPSSATFSFDADGINPVVITIDKTAGSFALINGLTLAKQADITAPTVESYDPTPPDGVTGVPITQDLQLDFSEPIQKHATGGEKYITLTDLDGNRRPQHRRDRCGRGHQQRR